MAELNSIIDLKLLESEVRSAIEEDRIYRQQNDAKIRAVTDDKVTSYEQFRERVNAAHLRPLEKTDQITGDSGFKTIWNPAVSIKKPNWDKESMADQCWDDVSSQAIHERLTRLGSPSERYNYLKESGTEELTRGLRREVPVGVLGDIVEALSAFPNTTEDILFVVSVLDALTKTDRFRLSLDFLTCAEKDMVWSLMDKLSKSFNNRHQDLAEEGVTEWTVEGLREKYCVSGKKPQE